MEDRLRVSLKRSHPGSNSAAYRAQVAVLLFLLLVYCFGTAVFMQSWTLILAGIALPSASTLLGRATAERRFVAMEAPTVWGFGTFALFMVSIAIRFPMTMEAGALVALDSFVLVGAWAVHRLPAQGTLTTRPIWEGVRSSIAFGLRMAVAIAAFASVIFALGGLAGEATFTLRNWILLMLAYLAGGLMGGAVVGLLRRLTPWPLGRMVLGIAVACLLYGVVGIAMLMMGDPEGPSTLREAVGMGIGLGVILGPMGALAFHGGVWPERLGVKS